MTFEQLAAPHHVLGPMSSATFAAGCPAGHDTPPALAALADRLDHRQPGTDMYRFRDPDAGNEHWLGRVTPFDPWQAWDDRRNYNPGDPADVLVEVTRESGPRFDLTTAVTEFRHNPEFAAIER